MDDSKPMLNPRVIDLMSRDPVLSPAISPADRGVVVDIIFKLSHALRLQPTTPFIAARVLDKFLTVDSMPNRSPYVTKLAGVCSLDIVGKCVDSDHSPCGHVNSMPIYEHYAQGVGRPFSVDFGVMEMRIMRTLEFDPIPPSPQEYLSECTRWLDPQNAARNQRRPWVETVIANRVTMMLDSIVHEWISTEYASWELAAAASYIATENIRSVPQTFAIDPPQLRALWGSVPWTRSTRLIRELKSSPNRVFAAYPNGGLARAHPEQYFEFRDRTNGRT